MAMCQFCISNFLGCCRLSCLAAGLPNAEQNRPAALNVHANFSGYERSSTFLRATGAKAKVCIYIRDFFYVESISARSLYWVLLSVDGYNE